MELLIPGLILVAVMVWASTRIKRNAAAAFDAETIETSDFVIEKPAGYLHVLNDTSGLAFRAYSKEYGTVGNSDVRQASIEAEIHEGSDINELRADAIEQAETDPEIADYIDDGRKAARIDSTCVINGAEFRVFQKLVARDSDVFELRARVLADHEATHEDAVENLLAGLRVK